METASIVPPSTWLPEDDILLKNAIEDGASLEALAKGAVEFSHPFTLQEVQDRWHSLLYNIDVSAQACAHMLLDGSGKAKEIKMCHRKRKVGSIRKRYYAKLKRIRSEYFSSAGLGFLTENGTNFNEHVTLHDGPHVVNSMLGDCMSDQFGLQDFEILHQAFPEVMTGLTDPNLIDNPGDAFHCQVPDSLLENELSETARHDCLRGIPVAESSFPVHGPPKIGGMPGFQPSNGSKDIPLVEKMHKSQFHPCGEQSNADGFEMKDLSTFNSANSNPHNACAGFGESQHFRSPSSDVSGSLHAKMEFSPPLPSMPLWKTIEDVTAPTNMPVNASPSDKREDTQDVVFPGNDGSKSKGTLGEGVAHSRPILSEKQNDDILISSTSISNGEFVDIPESLFDFSNDETLFVDVEGKAAINKSSCDTTLSGFSMDVDDVNTPKAGEKGMIVANADISTGVVSCSGESEVATSHILTGLGEDKTDSQLKVQMLSTPASNNKSLECKEGKFYCALNTEDPEIPCNDDIFLLIHPAAPSPLAMTSIAKSALDPVSVNERKIVQGQNLAKKREDHAQTSKPSLMCGPYLLPEMSPVHAVAGSTTKCVSADICCTDLAPRHKAVTDPTQCRPAETSLSSYTKEKLDKDVKKVNSGAAETSNVVRELPLHAEAGHVEIILPEPVFNPSTSDKEEPESDHEDPHFSDIEAMILEMDLGSYDEDLFFTRRVAKYQHENSKRQIIRLEQCARSSVQRAMTSRGALAVLSGRRSRHFIRKTEVTLGRATEETVVDIDLGKEARHNKISRRQAIVKMEGDGTFSLKNLAKHPMSVNGTEVGTGELIGLGPSCLIEIRGISFVFESNQKFVKRYLESIAKKKQGQTANFEWSTKVEP